MDGLVIVLRLAHIVPGVVWVGMMAFNVAFLMPALREAGPAGGAVMAELQRRRLMTVLPIIALVTIVSGLWLMQRVWRGMNGILASRPGLTLLTGAVLSLVAFLLGILVMRPAMTRAGALAQALGSAQDAAERQARAAELERLRARGTATGQVIMVLLLLAAAAMAVARYV